MPIIAAVVMRAVITTSPDPPGWADDDVLFGGPGQDNLDGGPGDNIPLQ